MTWDFHNDWDGRYTSDTDLLGNVFSDTSYPSSVRAWVQFDIVKAAPKQPIPEPSSIAIMLLGLMGMRRFLKA